MTSGPPESGSSSRSTIRQRSHVHGACGAWAVIFTGLFATDFYVAQGVRHPWGKTEYGIFLGGGALRFRGNQHAGSS